MMTIHNRTIRSEYRESGGRLPPFTPASSCVAAALPVLAPTERLTVAQAAEEYRKLRGMAYTGDWKNSEVPYMVEPMTMVTSRRFKALVFAGPPRSGKTASLVENTILHHAICAPRKTLLVHMDRNAARDYSDDEIAMMIRSSPELAARQETGRGADNQYQKLFKGAMRFILGWPSMSFFAGKTIPTVIITDRDRMTDSIDGEGDPLSLGMKRHETLGSQGMTIEESSPGRDVTKKDHTPKTPHEAPPTTGILGDFNLGTRGRFYWTCQDCGERFEPTVDVLKHDDRDSLYEAALTTYVACPHCGGVHGPETKRDLNANGIWLHESADGGLVTIDDPAVRPTDIVSYWMQGPPARDLPWSDIMFRKLEAEAFFEATGSETKLKATVNADQGRPYLSRIKADIEQLNAETLKGRATFRPLGVVPAEARFVTIQVDVQGNRFEVQVDGWGEGLERWLVDRFTLSVPPENAPGAERNAKGEARRTIQPHLFIEDWDVLDELESRVWPVAGADHGLVAAAVTIDRNGPPGTTDRAYAFWRARKKRGKGNRFYLIFGEGRKKHLRAELTYPETRSNRKKRVARDIPVIEAGSNNLKSEVAASLMREAAGPMTYHLPSTLPATVFDEFCAEQLTDKGWEKANGGARNEAVDLSYYGKALVIVLKAEKIDWHNPPGWAAPGAASSLARPIGSERPDAELEALADTAPAATGLTASKIAAARAAARAAKRRASA